MGRDEMATQRRPASRIALSLIAVVVALVTVGLATPARAAGSGASTPIDEKLSAAHFVEPLVAMAPTMEAENRALLRAVTAYEQRSNADDFRSLTGFLSAHPRSGWRAALLTNLGFAYLHYGYFSRAIEA